MKDNDIQMRKVEWRRKSWSIPDMRGGKQNWLSVLKELLTMIAHGQANDLNEMVNLKCIAETYSWRTYAPFLKGIGLVHNQSGVLCLTKDGEAFQTVPENKKLARLIQERFRLFAETLEIIGKENLTIEEIDRSLCDMYDLDWNNLSHIRKRMDWLEVLDLIQPIGNRKWELTESGKEFLDECITISPEVLRELEKDADEIEITEAPDEIKQLIQKLTDNPEFHEKRSTYNIWSPSPNRINNLHTITQAAFDRIERAELFGFIEKEFKLKTSSAESMLPFLKASGLIEEVGRNVYLATPAARAWLETGNDLDFIRILHSNMQYVGELIRDAQNVVTRNSLYEQGKKYGMNNEKVRWITGFLVEAGLLEETQYLHLKATSMGKRFMEELPLYNLSDENQPQETVEEEKKVSETVVDELDVLVQRMKNASCDPAAEEKGSGVAFEENVAQLFRYMGFAAERIGGSGDTDVVIKWKTDGKTFTAIADCKSRGHGYVSHDDISDVAIDTHKEKNKADYVAIIGTEFRGDTIRNHAKRKSYALITVARLADTVYAARELGLSLPEIALIFKAPNGVSELDEIITSKRRELDIISLVVSKFCKEQEELGGLSPRDLFLLSRDTDISPSLNELREAFDTLAKSEIGILQITGKNQSPENAVYELKDMTKTVNRLRSLALAIEKGIV